MISELKKYIIGIQVMIMLSRSAQLTKQDRIDLGNGLVLPRRKGN